MNDKAIVKLPVICRSVVEKLLIVCLCLKVHCLSDPIYRHLSLCSGKIINSMFMFKSTLSI